MGRYTFPDVGSSTGERIAVHLGAAEDALQDATEANTAEMAMYLIGVSQAHALIATAYIGGLR